MTTTSAPSLRALALAPVYTRNTCPDLLHGFYVPALQSAVSYDRATYNFSSEVLTVAGAGLAGLINNGGRMRLICQYDKMALETVQAIMAGYQAAEDALADSLDVRSITELADDDDPFARHHLELLTWLVKEGRLDIKVAIPLHTGASYHHKMGVIADAHGDRIVFAGSINESVAAWLYGDEHFSVYKSWDATIDYLQRYSNDFETLWNNRGESSMVIPLPEAYRRQLIDFAPARNPALAPPPPLPPSPERVINDGQPPPYHADPLPRAALWAAVNHAIAHDPPTTLETVAAELWPHQLSFWRRYARDATEPPRVLIADEVGLGKTIQAGILLKTFINRGQAERVLILTPAAARWQWQAELRHKFNIRIPVLDRQGAHLRLVDAPGEPARPASPAPWQDAPRLIISYDWLRRHREAFRADAAAEYDIVIFDEAHHARYLNVGNPHQRRPNSYLQLLTLLSPRTTGLLLLTATPMQIDPSELWALLNLLNPEGSWSEAEFRLFYDTNRPATLDEWDAARQTWLRAGPPGDLEQLAALARMSLPAVKEHLEYIQNNNPPVLRRDMTPERIRESLTLMRRTAAIKRSVSRHTRELLRQYVSEGKLRQTVPQREVSTVAVALRPQERELYGGIRDFVRAWYQEQPGLNQQALGFVMTHFRMRLASSRYAFRQSLLDLQKRRQSGRQSALTWAAVSNADDSYDDSSMEYEPDAELPDLNLSSRGEQLLGELLARCDADHADDSKFAEFNRQLDLLRAAGHHRIMVFSHFRDTQVWLRERLASARHRVGNLAGLSGPEDWICDADGSIRSVDRSAAVQCISASETGVLLCTETAAESLNFQFCSAVINYDIPWNPMKLEQRIGRIDRIGQESDIVAVVNLFYAATAEHDAYAAMDERIAAFTEHVGSLQPILQANLERIIRESTFADDNDGASVRAQVNQLPAVGFDLDDLAAAAADETDPAPRLLRADLNQILSHPAWLPDGYNAEPRGDYHWAVSAPNGANNVMTTNRANYDYAAGAVDFYGPGHPAFPPPPATQDAETGIPQEQLCPIPDILNTPPPGQ